MSPDATCAICGRTILAGERVHRYASAEEAHPVCELCVSRAERLGWRPEFPWARLVNWAAKHGGITLTERRPMPPMGHFSLIRYRKS